MNHSGIIPVVRQPRAQLCTRDVLDGRALGNLVHWSEAGGLLYVDDHPERHHLHPQIVTVLLHQLLGVVGSVERIAVRVRARAGVVTPDDKMTAPVVLADDRVPDRLARATHAHRQVEQREAGGAGRIAPHERAVAAYPGEVVHVPRLG